MQFIPFNIYIMGCCVCLYLPQTVPDCDDPEN